MSWTIPSREEAEEFTKAYLAAEESYYEEMEKRCENCTYFDNGICQIDNEAKDMDMTCKYFETAEVD